MSLIFFISCSFVVGWLAHAGLALFNPLLDASNLFGRKRDVRVSQEAAQATLSIQVPTAAHVWYRSCAHVVEVDLPVVGRVRWKRSFCGLRISSAGGVRLFVLKAEPLGVTVVAPSFRSAPLPSLSRRKWQAGNTKAPSSSCCCTALKSRSDGLISSSWSTPAQST